jgi:hypothetical protein
MTPVEVLQKLIEWNEKHVSREKDAPLNIELAVNELILILAAAKEALANEPEEESGATQIPPGFEFKIPFTGGSYAEALRVSFELMNDNEITVIK